MDSKIPMDAAIQKTKKVKKNMQRDDITAPPFHDFVGAKLKSYYAQIASEPIPDRFTELLKQLDSQAEAGKKKL
jgi:DNA-binding protein Fis